MWLVSTEFVQNAFNIIDVVLFRCQHDAPAAHTHQSNYSRRGNEKPGRFVDIEKYIFAFSPMRRKTRCAVCVHCVRIWKINFPFCFRCRLFLAFRLLSVSVFVSVPFGRARTDAHLHRRYAVVLYISRAGTRNKIGNKFCKATCSTTQQVMHVGRLRPAAPSHATSSAHFVGAQPISKFCLHKRKAKK